MNFDLLTLLPQHILKTYMGYQKAVEKKALPAPKRIIFYRDGVSEGQFAHVLERGMFTSHLHISYA